MKKIKLFCALLLAVLFACAVGCAESETPVTETTAPDSGAAADTSINVEPTPEEIEPEPEPTRVTVVVAEPLDELSIAGSANEAQRMVLDCVYLRGMYRINGALVSDVLASWEQTAPYSWRLRLYEDIADSDGNAFTAEDLVSCISCDKLASVSAVDELTVELTFAVVDHNALESLLSGVYLVTDEARTEAVDALPVGFGPYVLSGADEDGCVTLYRNENYWQPDEGKMTPMVRSVAEMLVFVYEENIVLRASYAARGDADLVYGLDSYHAGLITSGYGTQQILGTETVALFFNMAEGRLMTENPELRNAVACAIDRAALVTDGEIAEGLLRSDTVGYTPYGYGGQDMEAAVGYVKSARYRGQTLTLICAEEHADVAALIVERCLAAGLSVQLEIVSGDVKTTAAESDWDMALAPVSAVGDAASSYAACFAVDESGATWFNFSRSDVLYVARVIATVAGHDGDNIAMLENWLRDNPVVLGLYTPGTLCLVADSAGEPVIGDRGIIPGSLLPKEPQSTEQ